MANNSQEIGDELRSMLRNSASKEAAREAIKQVLHKWESSVHKTPLLKADETISSKHNVLAILREKLVWAPVMGTKPVQVHLLKHLIKDIDELNETQLSTHQIRSHIEQLLSKYGTAIALVKRHDDFLRLLEEIHNKAICEEKWEAAIKALGKADPDKFQYDEAQSLFDLPLYPEHSLVALTEVRLELMKTWSSDQPLLESMHKANNHDTALAYIIDFISKIEAASYIPFIAKPYILQNLEIIFNGSDFNKEVQEAAKEIWSEIRGGYDPMQYLPKDSQ